MNTVLRSVALAALLALGAAAAPRAGAQALAFSFDRSAVTLTPGQTVTFAGAVTNVSDTAPVIDAFQDVYIIDTRTDIFGGDGQPAPLLTTASLLAPPEPLADGDSFSSPFFSLTADPKAAPDTYQGRFTLVSETLSGGLYSDTQIFRVRVVPEVPEVSPLVCLGGGLLLLGGYAARRRRA